MAVRAFPKAIRGALPRLTAEDRFFKPRENAQSDHRGSAFLLGCAIVGGCMLAFQLADPQRPAPKQAAIYEVVPASFDPR